MPGQAGVTRGPARPLPLRAQCGRGPRGPRAGGRVSPRLQVLYHGVALSKNHVLKDVQMPIAPVGQAPRPPWLPHGARSRRCRGFGRLSGLGDDSVRPAV